MAAAGHRRLQRHFRGGLGLIVSARVYKPNIAHFAGADRDFHSLGAGLGHQWRQRLVSTFSNLVPGARGGLLEPAQKLWR
jgi:hypothetical protein